MKLAKVIVQSGWHERRWCPVQVEVALKAEVDLDRLYLHDPKDDATVSVQAWRLEGGKVALAWIIGQMEAQQTRAYELRTTNRKPAEGVRLVEKAAGVLEIHVGGEHFTTYNYGPQVVRPYLYPVLAEEGMGVTRDWPMKPAAPGETTDHPHHKGIWTAQGAVNGVDNWSEDPNHGYQLHRAFEQLYSGAVAGGFTEKLDWSDAQHRVNMTETRRLAFYMTPPFARLFDYQVTLHTSEGQVTLGDTKEGGLISLRVASSMDAIRPDGGRITNGVGSIQEPETWGKRAPWCDYSGPLKGQWYGVCFMDHETNPRYPTYWHVRNYGLMTANCFGLHDYTGDPNQRWDMVIPAGTSVTWKYRVIVHSGDAASAALMTHFHDFIHPPKIEVQL